MGGFRSSLRREGDALVSYRSSLDATAILDSFTALTGYVERHDSGTPIWYVASTGMSAINSVGSQSTLSYTGMLIADGYAEVTTASAQDSGIVVRLTDQNNFYLLALSDDSGANPSANLRLFKRVGGSFSQLGSSVDVTWTRGTSKTFRLQCVGSSITALMDGTSQIAVTDTSLAGPGYCGLRSNAVSGDIFTSLKRGPA